METGQVLEMRIHSVFWCLCIAWKNFCLPFSFHFHVNCLPPLWDPKSLLPASSFVFSRWWYLKLGLQPLGSVILFSWVSPVNMGVPGESACNAWDPDSMPGSERSLGEGNGYPLQYSCLENSMDRGTWRGYRLWGCKKWDTTGCLMLSLHFRSRAPQAGEWLLWLPQAHMPIIPQ